MILQKIRSIKEFFKQNKRRVMYFFYHKRIVYSTTHVPGEFVHVVGVGKQRFIRVQFSNKVKIKGTMPYTDIKWENVKGIGRQASDFEKWLYRKAGKKAPSTYFKFKN